HANQTMKECKYTALPDQPPQIVLENPRGDVTLSVPAKVHVALKAFDDFGLREVALYSKRGDIGAWHGEIIRSYAKPQREDTELTAVVDLPALKLATGEFIRCRAEAVDRKGQRTSTPEFAIR